MTEDQATSDGTGTFSECYAYAQIAISDEKARRLAGFVSKTSEHRHRGLDQAEPLAGDCCPTKHRKADPIASVLLAQQTIAHHVAQQAKCGAAGQPTGRPDLTQIELGLLKGEEVEDVFDLRQNQHALEGVIALDVVWGSRRHTANPIVAYASFRDARRVSLAAPGVPDARHG